MKERKGNRERTAQGLKTAVVKRYRVLSQSRIFTAFTGIQLKEQNLNDAAAVVKAVGCQTCVFKSKMLPFLPIGTHYISKDVCFTDWSMLRYSFNIRKKIIRY